MRSSILGDFLFFGLRNYLGGNYVGCEHSQEDHMPQHNEVFPMAGIWYSSDTPDAQVRGILERPDSGQTILNLCCLSEDEYEKFRDAQTIQGMSSSGQKVTLLDCFVASGSQSARSDSPGKFVDKDTNYFWNIKVFVNYTLIGAFVPDTKTESFKSITLQSAAINDWGHRQYFECNKKTNDEEPLSIIYQCSFCNDTLSIRVIAAQTEEHGLFSKRKKTDLRIELTKGSKTGISARQAIDIGYPLLRLLVFLCNQDHGCKMLELGHGDYEVAQLHLNDKFSGNNHHPHVGDLLSLRDLNEYLPAMLTAWYNNHSKYVRMGGLFRHTLSDGIRHDEELITAYVRILEIMLDREKYSLTEGDDKRVKDAKNIIKTIKEADIKKSYLCALGRGKDKGNTEYFIAYLKTKFNTSIYFKQLLESLRMAIKIRNAETHLKDFEPTTQREYVLNDLSIELLQTLIKLRLLEKLGVPEDECMRLFDNHMHFHMHKHNFKHLGKMLIEPD